jgi:tripartite ATP-independent transporter DctM subunit
MSIAILALMIVALLFILFLLGLEIGFAMAVAGFVGFGIANNFKMALDLAAMDFYATFSSYGFTIIPLFILMGNIGASAGVSKSLYDLAHKWLGHISGGLAIGTVFAATLFKAICGSGSATSATFSTIAVPEMDRYGYSRSLSTGTVATVGTLGGLLPPSVGLVIYGLITGTSIGRLFMAGIVPGLIVAFTFVLTLYFWCKIRPDAGPKSEKSSWRERFAALPSVLGVLIVFVVVVGGLMVGYFSPSESASIGAAAVLVLVTLKRDMTWKRLLKSVMDSVKLGCMVLTLIAGATVLSHFFAITRMPFYVGEWLSGLAFPRIVVVIIILGVYLVGGSFIEDGAFFILATPIFFPIVQNLGYDLYWFCVVLATTIMIGVILPPMAVQVFVVSGITKTPLNTVYKGIYPFLFGLVVCNLLFLFVPQISLWLPNLLMK